MSPSLSYHNRLCWAHCKSVRRFLSVHVVASTYGVLYKQSSSIAFDVTSSYWSALKNSKFFGFSLVTTRLSGFYCQHFVATRIVLLPKSTETHLITESDLITSYCSYARPAQPGPILTMLCGPCIAVIAGLGLFSFFILKIV